MDSLKQLFRRDGGNEALPQDARGLVEAFTLEARRVFWRLRIQSPGASDLAAGRAILEADPAVRVAAVRLLITQRGRIERPMIAWQLQSLRSELLTMLVRRKLPYNLGC